MRCVRTRFQSQQPLQNNQGFTWFYYGLYTILHQRSTLFFMVERVWRLGGLGRPDPDTDRCNECLDGQGRGAQNSKRSLLELLADWKAGFALAERRSNEEKNWVTVQSSNTHLHCFWSNMFQEL